MQGVQNVFRSLGLAVVGTMHPRMLWLSFRPFLIVSILWGVVIWLIWSPALDMLRVFLTTSIFTSWIQTVLTWVGLDEARAWVAPLFLVMLLIPLIATSLLVYIAFSTVPAIVTSVMRQGNYSGIEALGKGGMIGSFFLHHLVCLHLLGFDYVDSAGMVGSTARGYIAAFALGLANHAPYVV
jgi:hypothetical protein